MNLEPDTAGTNTLGSWVESVGFAIIDKVTFSVGSHDIETVSGDQLNIINELMRPDDVRLGLHTVLKTGRSATRVELSGGESSFVGHVEGSNGKISPAAETERIIWSDTKKGAVKELIVPLGLFFTKHPSQYFPLAAIAGCNDVRISIKFRQKAELIQVRGLYTLTSGALTATSAAAASQTNGDAKMKLCKLRCQQ